MGIKSLENTLDIDICIFLLTWGFFLILHLETFLKDSERVCKKCSGVVTECTETHCFLPAGTKNLDKPLGELPCGIEAGICLLGTVT